MNSLRVFKAAARLGSFARAASELNITPAAISQRIKKIEARCGLRFFERVGREVRLTERGNRLRAGVEGGLRAIEVAVEEAMRQPTSTYISIAARWLVPRLDRWREIRPGVDIRISTSGKLVDLRRDRPTSLSESAAATIQDWTALIYCGTASSRSALPGCCRASLLSQARKIWTDTR